MRDKGLHAKHASQVERVLVGCSTDRDGDRLHTFRCGWKMRMGIVKLLVESCKAHPPPGRRYMALYHMNICVYIVKL